MKLKLCLTILLFALAAACIVLIVILIPLLVLPTFCDDQIWDYEPVAATCFVLSKDPILGRKNCRRWSSCNPTCGISPKSCVRILVNYRRSKNEHVFRDVENNTTDISWSRTDVLLRINPKDCGGYPDINCEVFHNSLEIGTEMPCHYRRSNPNDVVWTFKWEAAVYPKLLAVGLPLTLLMIVLVICTILGFWYCRGSPGYDEDRAHIETERKYAFE